MQQEVHDGLGLATVRRWLTIFSREMMRHNGYPIHRASSADGYLSVLFVI